MTQLQNKDDFSLEEIAALLTGAENMKTAENQARGIFARTFADGPQGIRSTREENCTMFPALCSIGATWDTKQAENVGRALSADCIAHGVDMLLGPGANLKRIPQCGRNFEYVSEDPVLSGEIAAGYIRGLQEKGTGACLKHFAMNNQEKYRLQTSVEADERVMRELYLKSFEIAVKKGNPQAVMCAYNKVNAIWCSENKYLLKDILKDEWGYEGLVVSDWGAVQNICKAVKAGLDLQMPKNRHILKDLQTGLSNGDVTWDEIQNALTRVLRFAGLPKAKTNEHYDRQRQHEIAREAAADGIVLLKNRDGVLPITPEKYQKVGIVGEYAVKPLISGQGSAEVYPMPEYLDTPMEEIKKLLGDRVQIDYMECFSRDLMPQNMIWTQSAKWAEFAASHDLILIFAGSMLSEDTEQFDRNSISLNPNFDFVIDKISEVNRNTVVVLQSGSAVVLGDWKTKVAGIVEMWLAGEAAGGAIADVLTGKVNPSGKLPETFPKKMRTDLEYPGNGQVVRYAEGFNVGYRYYDQHPEQIEFPFGYGLSYAEFSYGSLEVELLDDTVKVNFELENQSEVDGSEVVQVYIAKVDSGVTRPIKELKAFQKVFVKKHATANVQLQIAVQDLAYYNACLREYVVEPGEYNVMVATSSRDIRAEKMITIAGNVPYSIKVRTSTMVG